MAQKSRTTNILDSETFGDHNRSYHFDIKLAKNNRHFLQITRRDNNVKNKYYKRTHVIFFADEIPCMVEALSMVLSRLTHGQMPGN